MKEYDDLKKELEKIDCLSKKMKNIIKNKKLNYDFYKLSYESKLEKQLDKLPKES